MTKKVYVEYTVHGNSVNDFRLESEFGWFLYYAHETEIAHFQYSTSNIFTRIRLGIVSGEVDFDVEFEFSTKNPDKDFSIPVNKYGAILNWPEGFCDHEIRMSETILRKALAMKKGEK